MNTAQFLAADPKVSAWVAASAGTGKTKVLTDRILNLLLHGYAPERILCLTFTKAAAAEMANRLTQRLARWATLSRLDLTRELESLLRTIPTPALLSRARQLFTLVLDAPGGMKIQTLHGFCQSVLGRFPLEAGITPHFRILDDFQAEELLMEAQHVVFTKPNPLSQAALTILTPYMADNRFSSIMNDFYQNRTRVNVLLSTFETIWEYVGELLDLLEVDAFVGTPQEVLDPDLVSRLKAQFAPEEADFEAYKYTFLTKNLEIRKKLTPDLIPQAERLFRFVRSLSALEVAMRTTASLILFQDIMMQYQDRKTRRGGLDYDDLIQQTLKLLQQPGVAAWVLYKLDGGIDHLLVDEAQDTNAAQWEIIQRLTAEFFTKDKPDRTIFAVGDAKQSIYSFQGANPQDFINLQAHFSALSNSVGQDWRKVELDLSYRSTSAILSIVDEVFAKEENRRGVSFENKNIIHQVFRDNHPGHVELWPLVEPEAEKADVLEGEWSLPLERVERRTPQFRLAEFVADQIATWLSSQVLLPSTNLPIQPRDILILARKRSLLGHEIIRALKKRDIPVAGADRLVLTDHIAVMDLLALGQFVLLPEDDLNLACVLRSPLIGMSEDDLFTLAHGREGTLWASLSQKSESSRSFEAAHQWLKCCLREADLSPVYEFYSWVLTQKEGRRHFLSRLGQEAEDALDEFLTQCLNYDQDHPSSMQGFVQFMTLQSQEIKRDASDTVHNQVRLMTVHGSKGLQAPIVILPDAAESGKGKWDPLLWTDRLVMLRPTQAHDTETTHYFKTKGFEATAEEKRRLLYVALTRAQDHLYVGGWTTGKELSNDCWYRIIQDALDIKSGSYRFPRMGHEINPREVEKESSLPIEEVTLPLWAQIPPLEPLKIKVEAIEEKIPPTAAMDRGIMIHRFFEYLPELPEDQRYRAACLMIEKEGLFPADWERDIHNTLEMLTDPEFKHLFGSNSLAEVPVSGMIDGVPFQGRIDRLYVTTDTLTIVDFKTNRNPAKNLEDVSQAYIKQLEGYETALRTIYPNHKISKVLLWTAGPRIQFI
ncbi:MAG: UvrD-helicase domain-containing protein [Alphaproteobacteria bacterium]|nr:UvrD-helicase domain-containing protein [Alphaproteobacteria bacterium]